MSAEEDEAAWAQEKEQWLQERRREWEQAKSRRQRMASSEALKPSSKMLLNEREIWLANRRREWEMAQVAASRRRMSQACEPCAHMPDELELAAAAKRAWLSERRWEREQYRATQQRGTHVKSGAPLVDAALLSTASEREVYLQRLKHEQQQGERERRRRSVEALRRPSVSLQPAANAPASVSEWAAMQSARQYDANFDEAVETGDIRQFDGGESTSAASSAERFENEGLDELELLEHEHIVGARRQSNSDRHQQSLRPRSAPFNRHTAVLHGIHEITVGLNGGGAVSPAGSRASSSASGEVIHLEDVTISNHTTFLRRPQDR